MAKSALIVGAGPGLSASLARLFSSQGFTIALAARHVEKLGALAEKTKAKCYPCDASSREDVASLFEAIDEEIGTPEIVVYNPSARVKGPFVDIDQKAVEKALLVTCYGGFLVAQAAAQRMLARGSGSIFFTSASAAGKGYVHSASFAMGKFGLRGLAQSMARELSPQNIHVGHFVIDGGIGHSDADDQLSPDAIAQTYLDIHNQHRSAWTWEVELRPWVETF